MLMRSRFSDTKMVLLVVGRGKTEISVHENVLFEASPVFKTAFTSRFKESSMRSIYLIDDNAALMDVLVQYLYAPESRLNTIGTIMQLLRLYALADKYDIVRVKNKICEDVQLSLVYQRSLSATGKLCSAQPQKSAVKFVYENTTSKTPMRRLLVDWFVWGVDLTWFSNEENRSWLLSVPEFAVDVCAVLSWDSDKKAKARPFTNEMSVYLEEGPVRDKN